MGGLNIILDKKNYFFMFNNIVRLVRYLIEMECEILPTGSAV